MPIVLTMRQPPIAVPNAIAVYDATKIQYGAGSCGPSMPPAIITAQITPAVFCASLPP
ncbi:hypothetical protein BH11MYX3_BH11MYX3_05850 [soil metagenome]